MILSLLPLLLQDPSPATLAERFRYDAQKPLDVVELSAVEHQGVRVRDVTFASPVEGPPGTAWRVTAYVIEPAQGSGPFAGIVFGHWGLGNRTEFVPEATRYAESGAVSVLIDYPWERPRPWWRELPGPEDPELQLAIQTQAVIDLRRALDLLLARKDVDAKRVAYVGHSYGAQWGAILSAVDERVQAAVLMAGIPDIASIWVRGTEPGYLEYKQTMPPGKLEHFVDTVAPLDAIRYVGRAAPTPLLMQFARLERNFGLADMQRYAGAASEPKTVLWYDTGHELNDPKAFQDRARWLQERIGLAPVRFAGEK